MNTKNNKKLVNIVFLVKVIIVIVSEKEKKIERKMENDILHPF